MEIKDLDQVEDKRKRALKEFIEWSDSIKKFATCVCNHSFIAITDETMNCPQCNSSIEWHRGVPMFYDDIIQEYVMNIAHIPNSIELVKDKNEH